MPRTGPWRVASSSVCFSSCSLVKSRGLRRTYTHLVKARSQLGEGQALLPIVQLRGAQNTVRRRLGRQHTERTDDPGALALPTQAPLSIRRYHPSSSGIFYRPSPVGAPRLSPSAIQAAGFGAASSEEVGLTKQTEGGCQALRSAGRLRDLDWTGPGGAHSPSARFERPARYWRILTPVRVPVSSAPRPLVASSIS